MALDASYLVRMENEEKDTWEKAAKRAGMKMSAWTRHVLNRAADHGTPEKQVPVKPGVEVELEPIVDIPGGKHRPYDPSAGEVIVEPVPGAKQATKPKKSEVTPVVSKGMKPTESIKLKRDSKGRAYINGRIEARSGTLTYFVIENGWPVPTTEPPPED